MASRADVEALLRSCFSTDELRRLFRYDDRLSRLVDRVEWRGSLFAVVEAALNAVIRDGALDALWPAVRVERPGRAAEIARVEGWRPSTDASGDAAGAGTSGSAVTNNFYGTVHATGAVFGVQNQTPPAPAVPAPPSAVRATASSSSITGLEWDLFLAHANPDKDAWARPLYAALSPRCRVFLDEACTVDGRPWTHGITGALERSAVVAVLVSEATPAAHFLGDEVQAAIARHREDGGRTPVIPVWLAGKVTPDAPYGLRTMQGVMGGATEVIAQRLADAVLRTARLRRTAQLLDRVLPTPADLDAWLATVPPPTPVDEPYRRGGVDSRQVVDDLADRWPALLPSLRRRAVGPTGAPVAGGPAAVDWVAELWARTSL